MAATRTVLSIDYIQTLKRFGYDFKLNLCNDRVEVNGKPLSDVLECEIFTKLTDAGYPNVNVARRAFVAHALQNAYHPIRDFLNSLSYQGGNYITALAGHFTNADGTFEKWLKRWLIGAVRRVMQPGAQNRMFVLDGPQGIGKSKFVEWLVPPTLRERHFKSGPINPENKDHKIALMERWIWEVAELGSTTRKADRDALKDFITLERVTERMPYDRYETQKPALTSFIGTVNNEGGLLSDPTGNRRFMFSKITGIDWSYAQNVNINDVWAEAVMLYLAGEPADLTADEKKLAEEINQNYKVEDPLEAIFFRYFKLDPSPNFFTPSLEIVETILDPNQGGYRGTTDMVSKKLAAIMTELGIEKARRRHNNYSNPVSGYVGIRKI